MAKRESIDGAVWHHAGSEITLDTDGWFRTEDQSYESLKGAKEAATQSLAAQVKVTDLNLEVVTEKGTETVIRRVLRNGKGWSFGGPDGRHYFYPSDKIRPMVDRIRELNRELQGLQESLTPYKVHLPYTYGTLTPEKAQRLHDELLEDYQRAKAFAEQDAA